MCIIGRTKLFPGIKWFATKCYTTGPTLRDFINARPSSALEIPPTGIQPPPYLLGHSLSPRKVFIETYGCQMNFNDAEIVLGILQGSQRFVRVGDPESADVVLLMTCAIRENAETKIWNRLDYLQALERRLKREIVVGVLGCMAERLKTEMLEKKRNVDVVCGPDSYKHLPQLLEQAEMGQSGVNVLLSLDETYADVSPVRLDPTLNSAFVSIMRGCDNMCAFCIVPFTRGRERSRPTSSILGEVRRLADEGIKEITLLGQNVNSYNDESDLSDPKIKVSDDFKLSKGFRTVYKPKVGGQRFVDLLDKVSMIAPDVRIRFTSPHPKDFPDDLLYLMKERKNICKHIHLPAQSGSTSVLDRMRRGYTREAYLELVDNIRSIIPEVSLSTDLITGFCGETELEHQDTLSLLQKVQYDMAYMFAYSMREKTMAHRRYHDDIPEDVKQRRLCEVIDTFYSTLSQKSTNLIGKEEVVLVEGRSKKSLEELCGRSDGNRMIVFPAVDLPDQAGATRSVVPGDLVRVRIASISGATPRAEPLEFVCLACP